MEGPGVPDGAVGVDEETELGEVKGVDTAAVNLYSTQQSYQTNKKKCVIVLSIYIVLTHIIRTSTYGIIIKRHGMAFYLKKLLKNI